MSAKTKTLQWKVTKNGKPASNQRELLATLFEPIALDLSKLMSMPTKEFGEIIERVAGLDLIALREQEATAFDVRKDAKKEAVRTLAVAEKFGEPSKSAPAALVDASELAEKLRANDAYNQKIENLKNVVAMEKSSASRIRDEINGLNQELASCKQREEDAISKIKPYKDCEPLRQEIAGAAEQNKSYYLNKEIAKAAKDSDEAEAKSVDAFDTLEAIRSEIFEAIEGANYPVEGLRVVDGEAYFEGRPLSSQGKARRLGVCASIGLALDPEINGLIVHDGSLFDEHAEAELVAAVERAGPDAFAFIEKVGAADSDVASECNIVLHDGEVVTEEF